jgi:hypothetical protein
LELAVPTFYKYALKHSYDLFIPSYKEIVEICKDYNWDHNRPASWLKVPVIKRLIELGYTNVLWLDSDVYINNIEPNILEYFDHNNLIQAFVVHIDRYEGQVPNCGVWLLNNKSKEFLDLIWSQEEFINHKWWEQGSNIALLEKHNNFLEQTAVLPYEFNIHKNDLRYNENMEKNGYFLHATSYHDRLGTMKKWAFKKHK